MTKHIYLLIPSILFFASCNVGPKYCPPIVELPDQFKHETANETAPHYEDANCWWEIFHDETLNQLEEMAVFNNQDIQKGIAAVMQEWAIAGVQAADLYPQINFRPSYQRTSQLINSFLPSNIPISIPKDIKYRSTQIILPLTASYLLDFWQKNWMNFEAAFFTAQAQEEALRNTILTITTDLAQRYFEFRSFEQSLIYLEEAIKVREDAVKINGDRFRTGLVSEIDLVQAQAELYSAISTYKDTIRQKEQAENMIAVLVGQIASEFCLEAPPLTASPPSIPAGIPSGLLLRRPDIAQAERMMASANADIGVAKANFYPDITISGALGAASPQLSSLFKHKARYWTYGLNIDQIIFDGGRIWSNWEATVAEYDQTEAQYKQTILQAFQEVEDALVAIKQNREQREALVATVNYNQRSVDLSQNRYYNGLVNYLEVEIQLRNLLQSQLNQQQVLSNEYDSLIQLIRALGGGWCSNDYSELISCTNASQYEG